VIERLANMPPGTLGFRVSGDVERSDYEDVLVPELDRAVAGGGGVRALYLIENLAEIEPAALWADSKLGFNLVVRHRSAMQRSAVVTDIEWMARAAKLFAWMIPGEAAVFPVASLEQAKAWVSGT
jgi:SpoIIAA-like